MSSRLNWKRAKRFKPYKEEATPEADRWLGITAAQKHDKSAWAHKKPRRRQKMFPLCSIPRKG